MKILVPVKRVPDTDQKIVASPDGTGALVDHIPHVVNPFDAIALEEAVRIAERLPDVDVTAVGAGPVEYEQPLRTALAMGATRAIRIDCAPGLDPWNIARLLRAIVERERPDIVLMGKQAVDDDANQTGQFLAALLDWPQATFASRLELLDGSIRVDRETDHGIMTVCMPLPAVVTVDLRLNEPRYASMAGIMKAKKKPLDVVTSTELGVQIEPRIEVIGFSSTQTPRRGERVSSVKELVERLLQEPVIRGSRS